MTSGVFVTLSATLAGMSVWHYDIIYQQTTISNIQWLVNELAYLYNAANQIGGLDIPFPLAKRLLSPAR